MERRSFSNINCRLRPRQPRKRRGIAPALATGTAASHFPKAKRSQQQTNLVVSAAEKYEYGTGLGVSAAEESSGLSCRRIWGSQQQKNMGLRVSAGEESEVSAAEEFRGLSSKIILPSGESQQQKIMGLGVSVAEESGVSAAAKGFQQHAGLRVPLHFSALM